MFPTEIVEFPTATPSHSYSSHACSTARFDRPAQSVHARGTFLGSKYAANQFLAQDPERQGERGTIINISSVAGGLVGVFECCQ